MNNTIKELLERKSVRQYLDKEISQVDKDLIIEASVNAPSAGNMQFYTILDITDEKIKETLAQTCDNQGFIKEAKMVLVYLADYRKWYEGFKKVGDPRPLNIADAHLAVVDATIAAQNAVTAAQSLGIGSCYIGDIVEQYETVSKILKLPKYVFPACMVVFGYPTKFQEERQKPERVKNKYILHENTYPEFKDEDYKDMWSYKATQISYEEFMKRLMERKYNCDFSNEMGRSLAKYLKDFQSDL